MRVRDGIKLGLGLVVADLIGRSIGAALVAAVTVIRDYMESRADEDTYGAEDGSGGAGGSGGVPDDMVVGDQDGRTADEGADRT